MADRGRGGYQPPQRPAAVSNPGSGQRTDGGAGSARQPIRVPTGGRYGEAQALEAQQRGAPLPNEVKMGGPAGAGLPQAGGSPGAFGPTQRPMESNAQMPAANAVNPAAASPQAALRVLYSRFPHPAIARLIDWSTG